jgi:PhoH-like ATPase
MKKIYLLDTNVLMHDPKALFAFDDNEVIIPLVVLDELDKHKTGASQAAKHARMVIRSLDELRALGDLSKGVLTERGGKIKVELNNVGNVPNDLDPSRIDNRIISVALTLQKKQPEVKIAVITKDINLRVKCDALGVKAEDYTSDSVIEDLDSLYTGHTTVTVESEDIDDIHDSGQTTVKNILRPLYPNEFVHLKSNTNEKHSALARYNGTGWEKIKTFGNIWGISSRNKEQAFALDALFNQDVKLVTITGKAGTGKTLLAAVAGVSQLLDSKVFKRIVLTRPIMPVGRDIGFLPGDIDQKMSPWMGPLYDNLDLIFSEKGRYFLDSQLDDGNIEIEPMTYIRGRSVPRSYIIVDEAQNLTRHEVKTIITRVGDGSKVILTGDIEQIDAPYIDSYDNGLSYAIENFKDESIAAHIMLLRGERSELATLAAEKL